MCPDNSEPYSVASPQFPARLTQLMRDRDYRVRKLAEDSRVDKGTISSWRQGRQKRYTIATVAKVAAVLGMSASDLLEINVDPAPVKPPPHLTPARLDLLRRLDDSLAPLLKQIPELEQLLREAREDSDQDDAA
jgi:transcriptional regulator with XRE-family HTH domain